MSAIAPTAQVRTTVELALRGSKRDVAGRVFQAGLLLSLLLSLLILIVLLGSALADAWPVLSTRAGDFVTSNVSRLDTRAGVRQGIVGSLILIGFVAVVAMPMGVAAAIYLQEYARDTRLNRLLITNIRNLAGVPSIVYGILGLVVFVQALRAVTGPDSFGRSYISGGMTLAVLVLPIIILITMEALRAVPKSIREAAYGVGATRWEVVRSHVLPYAAPGIFTGAILSLARAFGETAPLLRLPVVAGRSGSARDPAGPVHVVADPDLLVVAAGRRRLEGEHRRRHRRAAHDHPRGEPLRDPAQEPI
jgi:phosphate transport system permease protein